MSLSQGQSSAAEQARALRTDLDRGFAIAELLERGVRGLLAQPLANGVYESRVRGPGEDLSLVLFGQPDEDLMDSAG